MQITTREKLIEVARQLFDRKGLENTTMSDIASASDKGRRTIYTYFKNKTDIYDAVVEKESETLVDDVRKAVTSAGDSPEKRLRAFIGARVRLIGRHAIVRHRDTPVYKVLFMREIRRWERVRSLVSEKEMEILDEILRDGVERGLFDRDIQSRLPGLIQVIFQGIEVKWLHDCSCLTDSDMSKVSDDVATVILAAVKCP